jgi:hypothetical protein
MLGPRANVKPTVYHHFAGSKKRAQEARWPTRSTLSPRIPAIAIVPVLALAAAAEAFRVLFLAPISSPKVHFYRY